jgi:hypothetical protein
MSFLLFPLVVRPRFSFLWELLARLDTLNPPDRPDRPDKPD